MHNPNGNGCQNFNISAQIILLKITQFMNKFKWRLWTELKCDQIRLDEYAE